MKHKGAWRTNIGPLVGTEMLTLHNAYIVQTVALFDTASATARAAAPVGGIPQVKIVSVERSGTGTDDGGRHAAKVTYLSETFHRSLRPSPRRFPRRSHGGRTPPATTPRGGGPHGQVVSVGPDGAGAGTGWLHPAELYVECRSLLFFSQWC